MGIRVRFGNNGLWVLYREQFVGSSNSRFDFIEQ